ncbi:peptidoglycan DD-metalloendopeptidase family protein [Schinkia sp. CFF1]
MIQILHKIKTNMTRVFKTPHSNKSVVLKRAIITTSVIASISIGSVYASNDKYENANVNTVYHIYHKGELLGTVSDKSVINSLLGEKYQKAMKVYQDYEFAKEEQISYVPEKVFTPVYDNEGAVQQVQQAFSAMASAEAIMVDGKTVAFVSNKEEAEQVIKRIKMKYVPEEILTKLANGADKVEYNDLFIKDVRIKENVTYSEGKVFPEDILSVDEAVKLLKVGTLQEKKHVVAEGEVLSQIANSYDLTLDQLIQLNPGLDEDKLIHIDDELNVTTHVPLVTVVVDMEAVRDEVIPFEIEVKEDNTVFKGTTKVAQEGANGEKISKYNIVKENGMLTQKVMVGETIVKESTKKVVIKGTKVIPSRGTGDLSWPTIGGYISSPMGYRWGKQHKGIDIAGPRDRSILAADNGKVVSAGWDDGGYGNKIVINHNNGMRTVYGHLAKIEVKVGQTVSKGQEIGIMGSTGNSTGLHLHFEVYEDGVLKNPRKEL